jgi:hypothetical protein
MMQFSIKLGQTECVSELLDSTKDIWKILVVDKEAKIFLSPLMNTSQLKKRGITLILSIDSKRQPVPTSCFYLVSPTPENIKFIADDIEQSLYNNYDINFISPVPSNMNVLQTLGRSFISRFHVSSKVMRVC